MVLAGTTSGREVAYDGGLREIVFVRMLEREGMIFGRESTNETSSDHLPVDLVRGASRVESWHVGYLWHRTLGDSFRGTGPSVETS